MKRVVRVLAAIVVGLILIFAALLLLLQQHMIYFPREYEINPQRFAPELRQVKYTTSAGRQTSWYMPPRPPGQPRALVVMFNGNASLGLDWLDLLEYWQPGDLGFLMIDYPGYGGNPGRPSPRTIRESARAAVEQLAADQGWPARERPSTRLLGFSLGAAAALASAKALHPEQVILMAPFTSMADMARLSVGPPGPLLLLHSFDNRARLAELLARPDSPQVAIFHAADDEIIPVAMGRELAGKQPGPVAFTEFPASGHNNLPWVARQAVARLLQSSVAPNAP